MSGQGQDRARRRLTQAELGIWLGHQRAVAPAIYNAAEGTILEGVLDVSAFQDALARTLAEAPSLMASFVEGEGEPSRASLQRPLPLVPLTDFSGHTDPRAALEAAVARELERPFAIERGELYEHYLYRLAPQTHVWVHRAHHVALDGYGFSLIARRLADRYGAAQSGRALPEAPFDDGLRALAEDQTYQSSAERAEDGRFWLDELRGIPELPGAVHGPPARGVRSARMLSDSEHGQLRELAKRASVEWTELCVALVARAVYERTGQARFALGLPVMLRFGAAALRVPCMAMNIVPVPIRVAPEHDFASLARDAKLAMRRARPHLRYRYEHLGPALGRRPFGPVVNLIPFEPPRRFGSLEAEPLGISAGPVEELAYTFRQRRGALELVVEGHPDHYTSADVTQLREHLLAALAGPGERLKARLVGAPPVHPSLSDRIAELARTQPEALALVTGDAQLTYAQLDAAARAGAHALRASGVEAGSLVAIDAPRGLLGVLAALSSLYAGAGYSALDPHHPPARREAIVRLLAPVAILRAAGVVGPEPEGVPVLTLTAPWQGASSSPTRAAPTEPAYVVFTSGSTGEPKGVVVGHGALDHFVTAALATYGILSTDRVLQFAALTFDASVEELAVTWAAGATLVLRDDAMLESVPAFVGGCAARGITVLDLPTAFWHELCLALDEGTVTLPPSVRLVIVGGEAVAPERLRQWQKAAGAVRLLNTYGPSEATIVATCADLSEWDITRSVPIGRALPGVSAVLLDDSGRVVEQSGVLGELHLLGPTLARGYLGRADLTSQRFFSLPGRGRAYATGDLASLGEDGQLHYVGRRDDELKISGHRVAPAEVEAALLEHPAVRASVVYGVRSDAGAAHLVAHLETSEAVTVAEVRRFLGEALPPAMIPTVVRLWTSLPRNSHGKLDRAALRGDIPAANAPATAASPALLLVMAAWQDVLGAVAPAPDDDFFSLGGTSLQVIQLANRLSRRGAVLSVASIFRHPTPRAQAELLSGAVERARPELEPVSLGEWSLAPASPRSVERVLVTGATGFVGHYLLRHLLLHTSCHVVVLVRGADPAQRVAETSRFYGFSLEEHRARLEVVTEPTAVAPCAAIINAAAEVSLTRDYRSLLDANVRLVAKLLDVAARWRASFHQVSSIAAIPRQPGGGPLPETFAPGTAGLEDGYQLSKWQAEQLCRQASERGLPVAVYRLGRVAAATVDPRINPRDIVWRIAAASSRLGSWPDLRVSEPWIPVDVAARSLVCLLLRGSARAPAGVYHLTHTGSVALDQLRRAQGLPRVALGTWLEQLRRTGSSDDAATAAFFELRGTAPASEAPRRWSYDQVLTLAPELEGERIGPNLLQEHVQAAILQGVLARRE